MRTSFSLSRVSLEFCYLSRLIFKLYFSNLLYSTVFLRRWETRWESYFTFMYLAKRIAYSTIYQIDETFIVAGDRKRCTRNTFSYHSIPRLRHSFEFAIGKCANRVLHQLSYTHRDADDAALIQFCFLIVLYITARDINSQIGCCSRQIT